MMPTTHRKFRFHYQCKDNLCSPGVLIYYYVPSFKKMTYESLQLYKTLFFLNEEISEEGKHGQEKLQEVMDKTGKQNTCL